jgi:hypothetical protein
MVSARNSRTRNGRQRARVMKYRAKSSSGTSKLSGWKFSRFSQPSAGMTK